ncbi:hypothetical protein C8J56DRAFT_1055057 [Mycena floridula]|nr:hypothetical protein C8J56DRAFT_1055057 [Mycena floridula]
MDLNAKLVPSEVDIYVVAPWTLQFGEGTYNPSTFEDIEETEPCDGYRYASDYEEVDRADLPELPYPPNTEIAVGERCTYHYHLFHELGNILKEQSLLDEQDGAQEDEENGAQEDDSEALDEDDARLPQETVDKWRPRCGRGRDMDSEDEDDEESARWVALQMVKITNRLSGSRDMVNKAGTIFEVKLVKDEMDLGTLTFNRASHYRRLFHKLVLERTTVANLRMKTDILE